MIGVNNLLQRFGGKMRANGFSEDGGVILKKHERKLQTSNFKLQMMDDGSGLTSVE
jgi:hypothetical protein